MRKLLTILSLFSVLALTLSSCDNRRELFSERMIYGQVNIDLDWSMVKSEPNGGTVVFFPDTTSVSHFPTNTKIIVMMNGTYEEVLVPYMNYQVISFNETYEDFDYIKFRSVDSPEEFEAYTESISVASKYTKANEYTVTSSPDPLYIDNRDTISVIRDPEYDTQYELKLAPERVSPLIGVKVYIHGMDNMSRSGSAASISGVSEGLNMATKTATGTPVAHMFTIDQRTFADNSYQDGYTSGQLYIFGVPDSEERIYLTLYIRLRDGSDYQPMTYDITDRLQALRLHDGTTNVTLNLEIGLGLTPDDPPIVLPYVEDRDEPGTGFDPRVEDWGDEINEDIPI